MGGGVRLICPTRGTTGDGSVSSNCGGDDVSDGRDDNNDGCGDNNDDYVISE